LAFPALTLDVPDDEMFEDTKNGNQKPSIEGQTMRCTIEE